jgi:hypothetical protein
MRFLKEEAVPKNQYCISQLNSWFKTYFTILIAVLLIGSGSNVLAANRLALVIGNSSYKHTSQLKNPANDADLISGKLRDIGFDVITNKNVTLAGTSELINKFAQKIKDIGDDGIVLFYYAGHGIQYNGENFIVPVDANLQTDTDIILQGVNTSIILKIFELSGAKTNVVVLDACRNNPFPAVSRSVSQGLARMDSPSGSFIAYSTAPGKVALDGTGKNSPYTTALAKFITDPDLTLEAVFKKVRRKVYFDTEKAQTTWESTSLIDEVYLVDRGDDDSSASTTTVSKPQSVVQEEEFWEQIRDKNDLQLFKTYLKMFPDGKHREIALAQLSRANHGSKHPKPQVQQQFDYTDNELEARISKFNAIIDLMGNSNIHRAIMSYDRYTSWCCENLKKGPTGKERYIAYGLYGLNSLSEPESWVDKFQDLPLRQPAFDNLDNTTAALINAFLALHPVVQKANQYYSNQLYQFDNAEGARNLHRELYSHYENYISAYTNLAGIILEEMKKIQAQEIDYVALKNGKSWEWYTVREKYYLIQFFLTFQSNPDLDKKVLESAYSEYQANFLEIADFSAKAPAPKIKFTNLLKTTGERMKKMKNILVHNGKRDWSLQMDVIGWIQ